MKKISLKMLQDVVTCLAHGLISDTLDGITILWYRHFLWGCTGFDGVEESRTASEVSAMVLVK